MINLKEFIGTWRTTNFPGCVGNDEGIITLHVSGSGIATLWKKEGKKSTTFSEGKLEVVDNNDGSFDLVINGQAVDVVYRSINGNLYTPVPPPPSFVCIIPNHGKRYFQKLGKFN